MDWQAVGAVAGGVAAVIGIPAAVFAAVTALQAKRQAGAAEDQADAAMRMAKLAEADQKRATEPVLRVARYPDGRAAVVANDDPEHWRDRDVSIWIENIRDVAAELTKVSLNGKRGQFVGSRAVAGQNAIVSFPIDSIGPYGDGSGERGDTHRLTAEIHVPDSGKRGTFTAAIWLQGGHWNAGDEQLDLDD